MKRIILGVSGASGVIMSLALAEEFKKADYEMHLIVTDGAKLTWQHECGEPVESLYALADHVYTEHDHAAVIASGSYVTDGMVIMPCSMKSLAGIVSGYADNLLLRAADVCLKENRKLVLVPREMPLGRIHLRNMSQAADCGCVIVPPVLTFYNGAETVEEQISNVVGKVLLQFGIAGESFRPWQGAG
ncbi:MAG: UbiX family flavin prenyltransferase [Mogibacterium sp.]|nr:UbiX family flavin prenyltransferase [Mogibacterium sp.]